MVIFGSKWSYVAKCTGHAGNSERRLWTGEHRLSTAMLACQIETGAWILCTMGSH